MLFKTEAIPHVYGEYPEGFGILDACPIDNESRQIFGQYAISDTTLLETPESVLTRGEVLTNPSQIEKVVIKINNIQEEVLFAYLRQEPTTLHLGHSASVPYRISEYEKGKYRLEEFADAQVLAGEDPRITSGVNIRGALGAVHTGWMISTVVAIPQPDNPADVQGIKQVFYWGGHLNKLEPILEIEDLKNTCILPLARITGDDNDTRIDVFGRPNPDITYFRVNDIAQITKDAVESAHNLTRGFLPEGIHVGVNTPKDVPGYPDLRELDIHEAHARMTLDGKELHYRLGRYGLNLATGILTPLGVIAERKDFPDAIPKPPENGVSNYMDILYGSMGRHSLMLTGVSDRYVGIAQVTRVK